MDQPPPENNDSWPVVRLDVSHLGAVEAARAVHETLMTATERREDFVAVVVMPAVTERPSVIGAVSERVRMLKQLRPRLKQHCRGLAFVLAADAQAAHAKAIRAGARLWGCPTFTSDDPAVSMVWAEARLTGASNKEGER